MRRFPISITIILVLIVNFVGCTSSSDKKDPGIDPQTEAELRTIQSDADLPSVQIAVIEQNQIVWSKTLGQYSDINVNFMNGSVQKVFDATAVLQLFEQGLIDLDADINTYLPFEVRHPQYPDTPITARMLLSHQSGLDSFRDQFAWDTACLFHPDFRNDCKPGLPELSLEEYLIESYSHDGSYYSPNAWILEPGEKYHYSVSTFPLLHYLIEQVSETSYPEYLAENIFEPLGMENSGFYYADFSGKNATPHTRIDGENVELTTWDGNGYLMRTTAEDMAVFMLAHMNEGSYNGYQLLKPETIKLMQKRTSRMNQRLFSNNRLNDTGYGLGLIHYTHGWVGHGGSTIGYQTLMQFHPSEGCGYVIMTNVNGILGNKEDFLSVWDNVASIRDILFSQTNPAFNLQIRFEVVIFLIAFTIFTTNMIRIMVTKRRKRKSQLFQN